MDSSRNRPSTRRRSASCCHSPISSPTPMPSNLTMLITRENCIERAGAFEDSAEIAEALRDIAEETSPGERDWLIEAAIHIEGQHDLMRSMTHHLKHSPPDTTQDAESPATAAAQRHHIIIVNLPHGHRRALMEATRPAFEAWCIQERMSVERRATYSKRYDNAKTHYTLAGWLAAITHYLQDLLVPDMAGAKETAAPTAVAELFRQYAAMHEKMKIKGDR